MGSTVESEAGFPLVRMVALSLGLVCVLLSFIPVGLLESALTLRDGMTARTLLPYLPGILLLTGAWLLLVGGLAAWIGPRVDKWILQVSERLASKAVHTTRTRQVRLLLFVCALVLLFDGPSLRWGYFEDDDFTLLRDDRDLPLGRLLTATHGDHVLAGLRLEVRAMHFLFGTHAVAYNVAVLMSFALLLYSGSLLLLASGVSRFSVILYLSVCVGWTSWGTFTTGLYIVQKYMQIATCGALAMWGWVRWKQLTQERFLWVVVACVAFSCWMNVSGFYVPCALLAFAACDVLGTGTVKAQLFAVMNHRVALAALLLAILSAVIFDAYVYSLPTNSRFMDNAKSGQSVGSFVIQLGTYFGTVVLSTVVPFPHHLAKFSLLGAALIAAIVVGLSGVAVAAPRLDARRRAHMFGVLLTLLGLGVMICLGRPNTSCDFIWEAGKYTGPGFFWMCLVLAYVADGLGWGVSSRGRLLRIKCALLFVVLSWTSQGVGSLLCACDVPFFRVDSYSSRWSKLKQHVRRRQALQDLRDRIIQPLVDRTGDLAIPNLDGRLVCRRYPALTLAWGDQPRLATFSEFLADRPERLHFLQGTWEAAPTLRGVRVVSSLSGACSAEFLAALRTDEELRDLVLGPTVVTATSVDEFPRHASRIDLRTMIASRQAKGEPNDEFVFESDGTAEVVVREGVWDPEADHVLFIEFDSESSAQPLALGIQVVGEMQIPVLVHRIEYPQRRGTVLRVELLQLNAYALDRRIRSLRLRLLDRGNYRFRAVALGWNTTGSNIERR